MEAKPGFDLEQKLNAWREALASSPAVSPEAAEELEGHLRDSMARLREAGLSAEEAYLVAARRLGSADALGEEFGKLGGSQVRVSRAFWMVMGTLAWLALSGVSSLVSTAAVWGVHGLALEVGGYWLGWLGAAMNLLVFAGGLVLLWRVLASPAGAGANWHARLLSRPWPTAGAVALAFLVLMAARTAMPALLVRTTSAEQLGLMFAVQSGVGALAALVWPVMLVALLSWLYRRQIHRATAVLLVLALGGIGLFGSGCGKPAPATTPSASSAAVTPLEQALALWKQGEKEKAVEQALKVDVSQKNLFAPGNVLGYSEAQFLALPAAARDKLGGQLGEGLAPLKELARALIETGQRAAAAGDKAKADACSSQVRRLGESLSQPQYTALVQIVGKALVKLPGSAPQ